MSTEFAPSFFRRHPSVALAVSVGLIVFGCRLALIDAYGTDLPFQDEWGKVGDFVLARLREGDPTWLQAALLPHNEHRIYFTLGVDVLLTQLSGQWDTRQQCVVSALLWSIVTSGLAAFAWQRLPRPWGAVPVVIVIALAALPLVWQNILLGFQSQFCFLIGFSLLGIDGLLREPYSPRWWIGLAAMLCALVSMGSGFLCALAVVPFLFRDLLETRRLRTAFACLAAVAVFALGWCFHFEPPWHASLRSASVSDFVIYAAHCLAWPLPAHPMAAVLFYSPLLALAVFWFRPASSANSSRHAIRFTLAAGAWAIMQIAAVSYARGKGGGFPANRYGDVFATGIVANAFAFALLAPPLQRWRRVLLGWFGIWFVVLLFGVVIALESIFSHELREHRSSVRGFESTVRAYVRDGDGAALRGRPIPFPDYDWFIRLLDRPSIRAILPPSVSHPRHVSSLSRLAAKLSKLGWVFATLGLLGLALLAMGGRRVQRVVLLAPMVAAGALGWVGSS
ncbi:MAG TPA: hypothetical protein VJS88_00590 [Chthoniobacterales bacterium]|nr:hypothetical protein [Chthoniobacterales bacterium]